MMEFTCAKELLELCQTNNLPISEVMLRMEVARKKQSEAEIRKHLRETLEVMRTSCRTPLETDVTCIGGMIGGEAKKLMAHYHDGKALCGSIVTKGIAYAMSVMEQNSAMGCVVAAPTAGSSGVIPGVLLALEEELGLSDEILTHGLLCAGAIGYLYMRNASVAGAEAGCQAEIGAASAMAAAAITEMNGGTPKQALDAAAIAIGNTLGLVCDPVAGMVQCPCQMRNAMGVSNAFTCAEIACSGISAIIPFDEMLAAMYQIGQDMPAALRETALGGCAVTPTGIAWKKRIFGKTQN